MTIPVNGIVTTLNTSKTANLGPNDDVYFYDGSNNIMARIKNLTAFDYGCTQVIIDRSVASAGALSAQFWNAATSSYLTSKSFKVIPTNNTTSGSYQITLYYTAAEVTGFNAAATPSTFATSQVVKVSNGFFIPDVTPGVPHLSDAYVSNGTVAAFGTTGSTITATFSNTGFSGFAAGTPGNSLSTADFRSKATGNYSEVTKWEYNIFGSSYIDANQAPTAGSNVNIQAAHTITLDAGQTINTGKTLTVNGILNAGTNTVSGAGAFTLAAGAGFATSNTGTNGISQNITVSGTKTFTDGANYIFNGATTAPFGTAFSIVKPANVTIGATVTFDKPISITGILGFTGSSRALSTGNNLTMVSSATGTARIYDLTKDFSSGGLISGNTITGNATVERYIPLPNAGSGRRYRLLTPTVNTSTSINANWQEGQSNTVIGTNINTIPGYGTQITGSGANTNGFDKTQSNQSSLYLTANGVTPSYTAVGSTLANSLNAGTGYFLFIRGDRSMNMTLAQASGMPTSSTTLRATGTLLTGTQTSFTNAFTGGTGVLNLVTNPYASPIDWSAMYSDAGTANVATAYTLWDAEQGTRGGFVTVTNLGVKSDPSSAATVHIQPGQAFFVQATGAAIPALTIKESHKSAVNSNGIYDPQPPPLTTFSTSLYFTDVNGFKQVADGATAVFDNRFSAVLDDNDAIEINNWDENIAINRNGTHLAIEARPVIQTRDSLPLFMNNMRQMNYELRFAADHFPDPLLPAFLVDAYMGTKTPLSVTGSTTVPFTVNAETGSSAPDRFKVVFGKPALIPGTVINGITIYPNPLKNRMISVQINEEETGIYRLRLFNTIGQLVFTGELDHTVGSTTHTLSLGDNMASGNYQLEIILPGKRRLVKKLVIEK